MIPLATGASSNPALPIVAVLATYLAAFAVGRRLLQPFRLEATIVGASFHALLLGFTTLATAVFLLAALRLAYPGVVAVAVALLAFVGAVDFARLRPRLWPSRVDLPVLLVDIPVLLAVAFVLQFLPKATSPILNQDDLVYHVFLPHAYLQAHQLVEMPWHVNANMPHAVEVLYMVPMAFGDYTASKLFSYSFAALTLAGLWSIGRRVCGRYGAGLLLLVFLSGKNVQWHLGIAHIEPVVGAYLLGGALALYTWSQDRKSGSLGLVGLHCGFAAAAKYTGWMFAAAILMPALVLAWRGAGALRRTTLVVGPVLLLLLPWLVKNAVHTGNPIYPNLYSLLGGAGWSDVQELHYRLAMRTVEHAGPIWTWIDFVKMPFHLTWSDHYYSCPSFSIALMLLFLVAPFLPLFLPLAPGGRLFATVAWFGFVAWAVSVPQGRYLVAWVPVMMLPAAFALGAVCRGRRAWALATVVVLGLGVYQLFMQSVRFAPRWSGLLRARRELVSQNAGYALNEHLNRIVPPGGRVLGLWENRFFFLERDFEADAVWQVPSILARLREVDDAARFAEQLSSEGITHVVLRPAGMESYFANHYAYDLTNARIYPSERYARDRELMLQFIRDHLVPLARFGEYSIFRLGTGFAAAPTKREHERELRSASISEARGIGITSYRGTGR